MSKLYVAATILLTVYGQLVIKWRVSTIVSERGETQSIMSFALTLLMNPWVLSGFAAAFLASLTWMLAMRKLELSYAYPFMSLNFVLVLLAGAMLFGESVNRAKLAGVALIALGVIVSSRG